MAETCVQRDARALLKRRFTDSRQLDQWEGSRRKQARLRHWEIASHSPEQQLRIRIEAELLLREVS